MSRDDGVLYTGVTSVAANKVRAARAIEKQRLDKERSKIQPEASQLFDAIETERNKITQSVLDLIHAETSNQESNSILMAYKLYSQFLDAFSTSVQLVLKDRPTNVEKDASDE